MALVGTRLIRWGPFRRKEAAELSEVQEEQEESGASQEEAGAPLILLVPDVAGVASFRLYVFPEVESATSFVQSHLRYGPNHGIIAFWALHREPEPDVQVEPAEALLLIRDAQRADVVYPVSFVDMESAQSMTRSKVEEGVDPGLLMIYWALPVAIEADDLGRLNFSPALPPVAQARSAIEPLLITGLESPSAQRSEPDAEIDAPEPVVTRPDGSTGSPAATLSGESVESAAHEELPQSDTTESPVEATTESQEIPEEPARMSRDEQVEEETEGADQESAELDDVLADVDKVLRVKRWEPREGPFRGFGSPHGKF